MAYLLAAAIVLGVLAYHGAKHILERISNDSVFRW